MADFPALPLWTDAYIADTTHLTNEEHGVYLRLLMFAWRSPGCSLPDDDHRIAIMVGVTPKKWQSLRPVIEPMWLVREGKWMPNTPHLLVQKHPSSWPHGRWATVREAVIERDGEVCAYCGSVDGPFDVDHIVPRASGGRNTSDNLTVSCATCNRSKGAKPLDVWLGVLR